MPSDLLECKRGRERATAHRPLTHPVRVTERRAVMQPSNTPEEWRPVVGYEGYYEVSDHGNVRSLDRVVPRGRHAQTVIGRALSPSAKPSGHMQVSIIGADRKQRTRMVHQLVLDAFVGPCPEGMEACHADDDPRNNHVGNLRWGTRSSNMRERVANGRHNESRKTHCVHGHEFTPENTLVRRVPGRVGPRRDCRACIRERSRARRERLRLQAVLGQESDDE